MLDYCARVMASPGEEKTQIAVTWLREIPRLSREMKKVVLSGSVFFTLLTFEGAGTLLLT